MAVKRRASIIAAGSDSKRQCHAVAKAVLVSEALSDSCKHLLSGMAVHALSTYEADRHPFQKSVIDMVNTTITGIEEAMIKRNAETEATVGNSEAEKTKRAVSRTNAESEVKAKAEAAAQRKAASVECEAALTTAKGELADATKKQKAGDAAHAKVADKRAKVECFRAGIFTPLKDGTLEKAESGKAFKQISGFCEEFKVEKAMVNAAVDAFKQAPAERSAFLATAISQMEQKLESLSAELGEQLKQLGEENAGRLKVVEDANAVVSAAVAAASAAAAASTDASAEQQAAQAALKAADAACKRFFPDMKKMMDGFDDSKTALEDFQSKVMGAFKELETLAAPPPPVELEVAVEEPLADAPLGA